MFKRPVNGKKATTIPLKNAKIKTASVFGVDIKPERIESVKDDITLDRLFEIQGEKIDKRS